MSKNTTFDPEWVKTPTLEGRRLLYDGEIQYNDSCFERFLGKLDEYKLLDNTLIILMADHGEHLGEHGLWSHHPPGYIQVLHVPLIMVSPGKIPKRLKVSQPVQLIDIMPTVLDFASIDKSGLLLEGDSLQPLLQATNPAFWNNRLCISEEVCQKHKDDKNEWASIFYKNWHIINSKELKDDLSKLMKGLDENLLRNFFTMRIFDYLKDKKEEHYLDNFLLSVFLKKRVERFIRKLQDNNMAIWKALTKNTERIIRYNPKETEQLRALGYLQ